MLPINYVAVLVSATVAFIIGFLAHGPVSGKLWMKLANVQMTGKEKLSDMVPQMVLNLLVNLICAYALAVVYLFASTSTIMGGGGLWVSLLCALLVWFGFNITVTSIDVIWMSKNKKLWLFEAVASLVVFLSMGAIIALW